MSVSEQTSASKRDERYITAPSGKRITESEWMNGGDPEWTDEFKQKTFDNFHRQEFASPQQQPDTKIKTVSWEEYQSLYRDYYDMGLKVESLQKFKDYVHKRLDDAGVPVDPESPHKAAGCRIGGRLDLVLGQPDELSKAQADNRRWQESVANEYIKEIDRLEGELSKAQARIVELETRIKYLEELASDRIGRIIRNEP